MLKVKKIILKKITNTNIKFLGAFFCFVFSLPLKLRSTMLASRKLEALLQQRKLRILFVVRVYHANRWCFLTLISHTREVKDLLLPLVLTSSPWFRASRTLLLVPTNFNEMPPKLLKLM